MISAAEFKKHVSKTLISGLKPLGFKGSGFRFSMDSDDFVFVIGIQASRYGGHCYMEFGIQPKAITEINGHFIDMEKIKYYECEFRIRLRNDDKCDTWVYNESPSLNQILAENLVSTISKQVMPIVSKFKDNPYILSNIEVIDLEHNYTNVVRILGGMNTLSQVRLAWALTRLHGRTNPGKAREFAKFGLAKLERDNLFFGRSDFEEALTFSN